MNAIPQFLVLDRNDTRRKCIATALKAAVKEKCVVFSHNAGDVGWYPTVPDDLTPNLVLFHWNDNHKLNDNAVSRLVNNCPVRIAYSEVGTRPTGGLAEGWLHIPRPLASASQLPKAEWEELCQWILNPNRGEIGMPRALRHEDLASLLALRLLCEVWVLDNDLTSVRPDTITIEAPNLPIQWFAPFGKDANDVEAVKIASQMGEAREIACLVLRKIAGLSAGRKVTWPVFGKDIEDLRDALVNKSEE